MRKNWTVVALVTFAIVAGAYFLLPVSAHPYWYGNETEGYVPPMWDDEGFNGSYGPWHESYLGCPMWDYDIESGEPPWNQPPWAGPEREPSNRTQGYRPGPGCGMMGRGNRGGRDFSGGVQRGRDGMRSGRN